METRYFSYTVTSLQYRYGYITERFTGRFTWHRLRSANECRLRAVLIRFFLKSPSHPLKQFSEGNLAFYIHASLLIKLTMISAISFDYWKLSQNKFLLTKIIIFSLFRLVWTSKLLVSIWKLFSLFGSISTSRSTVSIHLNKYFFSSLFGSISIAKSTVPIYLNALY
jgi:hypothetical protein